MAALPQTTVARLAYEKTIPWTYYYSNVKHARSGDVITSQCWCSYFDGSDTAVGTFTYPTTQSKYSSDESSIADGQSRIYEKCYKFPRDAE